MILYRATRGNIEHGMLINKVFKYILTLCLVYLSILMIVGIIANCATPEFADYSGFELVTNDTIVWTLFVLHFLVIALYSTLVIVLRIILKKHFSALYNSVKCRLLFILSLMIFAVLVRDVLFTFIYII